MLGIPGLGLTPGAAAAVAQAAAAALQKLPLATAAAPSGLPAAPATAAGAAGEAAAKPSLSLEALEKAKKALQLQKEIKEKLAKSKLAQVGVVTRCWALCTILTLLVAHAAGIQAAASRRTGSSGDEWRSCCATIGNTW